MVVKDSGCEGDLNTLHANIHVDVGISTCKLSSLLLLFVYFVVLPSLLYSTINLNAVHICLCYLLYDCSCVLCG